jgi:hypothetical protein
LDFLRQVNLQLALERRDFVVKTLDNPLFHRSIQTLTHSVMLTS